MHLQCCPLSSFKTFSLPSPKETPYVFAIIPHSTPLPPQQPLIHFLSLWIRLSWTFHINGITRSLSFCVSLLYTEHQVVKAHPRCTRYFIPFRGRIVVHCVYIPHFIDIYLFTVDGHWGCFHLAIHVTVSMGVQFLNASNI